jgi:hypothetical protein
MKAITIKQPYASLIVEGIKDIENRTWKCPEKYIGQRVLIHAAQKPMKGGMSALSVEQIYASGDWFKGSKLVPDFGAIIGSVKIVDCLRHSYHSIRDTKSIWAEKDCWHWVLANPIKFAKPIQIKGKLNFWESECEILICNQCGQYCLHDNKDIGVPNWGNPVHICEHCGNMMLESEFEYLK